MSVSDDIRSRLIARGAGFNANDNIADAIEPGDLVWLEAEVQERVSALLDALVIDTTRDHNTKETARRVAKLFVREVMRGRYEPRPRMTDFPNAKGLDEVAIVGPITIRSMCSHHLVPIIGTAWVGVIPTDKLIGLSKFTRLADWVFSRPQIQEEATVQLADLLMELINPKALAVVVRASHMCMTWRGVRDADTEMVTSVMRGAFLEKPAARAELLAFITGGKR